MAIDPGAFSNSLLRGLQVGQGMVMNAQDQRRQAMFDKHYKEDRKWDIAHRDKMAERNDLAWERQQKEWSREDNWREAMQDLAFIEKSIEAGNVNTPEFYAALNRFYSDQVNQGGPEGATKEWVGAVMTPKGFIPRFKVTMPDGSSYIRPMTGPNRDEHDTDVTVIPVRDFFNDMGNRKMFLEKLNARHASLNPEAYFQGRAGLAKEEREREFLRQQQQELFQHQTNLQREKDRAALARAAGAQRHTQVLLKTGITTTLEELRKSWLADHANTDPLGNFLGAKEGSKPFTEWVNEQAVEPFFHGEETPTAPVEEPPGPKGGLVRGIVRAARDAATQTARGLPGVAREWAERAALGAHDIGEEIGRTVRPPEPQGGLLMERSQQTRKSQNQTPVPQGTKLDRSNPEHEVIAREYLRKANGDPKKAAELAKKDGYKL